MICVLRQQVKDGMAEASLKASENQRKTTGPGHMKLTIQRPDDWHLHLRDTTAMQAVVGHTAAQFGRAIIMPNLKPPVTTTAAAVAYRQRILDALPAGSRFQPLMTLYLTDNTPADEILRAHASGLVHAVKYYPAGATTHADSGVTAIQHCYAALEAMQETGLPLLVHGEVTDADIDIFDREAVFIERVLEPLLQRLPGLRLVLEHITTRQGIEFVAHSAGDLAGTLTAHHLLLNRNALFAGGIRPHNYCLPVLKREQHRAALLAAATSGNPKFFLGTDSAPHARDAKESACGCAGLYTAHAAIELYAEAFEQAGALHRLEGFASHFGADFYRLPRNQDCITLEQIDWTVPDSYPLGEGQVVPMRAGEAIHWRLCAAPEARR
jgi:dihydroorotase